MLPSDELVEKYKQLSEEEIPSTHIVFIVVINPQESDISYVKGLLNSSDYTDIESKLKANMKLLRNYNEIL